MVFVTDQAPVSVSLGGPAADAEQVIVCTIECKVWVVAKKVGGKGGGVHKAHKPYTYL